MKIIGITGPSGSGKSLLTTRIASMGYPVIDADGVYHSLLAPPSKCLDALREVFGNDIFSPDGTMDRVALAKIVFSDKEKLALLNGTVLPIVLDTIEDMIRELECQGNDKVILDAPTLIESGFYKKCHTVISVLCPKEIRVERIVLRDGISAQKAWERINAQKDDSFYREHSHIVITSDKEAEEFLSEAISLLSGTVL